MSRGDRDNFTTVTTEGAILPPDLLARLSERDRDLGGLDEGSYHLSSESIGEAISRSWNRLVGVWAAFGERRTGMEGEPSAGLTRERWLLPLFSELGYGRLGAERSSVEIEGKGYPISHFWGHAPIHLVGAATDLDTRTPGVAGAARMSPHGMVQELLNRSEAHLWAFVSNGRRLRILRDNVSLTRQAYVEFDLEVMMEGEVYPDFALLWMLCHQSRVEAERPEACWLESWHHAAAEQATRALEGLRDGVEEAITALGRGFLAGGSNGALREKLRSGELEKQDYYRQLLLTVYRLLFLFVAEDRGLLLDPEAGDTEKGRYSRYYSTRRLRHLSERRVDGRHPDLYRQLSLVVERLGDERGCPELGLPALGGFLFDRDATPDLAGAEISNRDLLEAVRALWLTRRGGVLRSVDYKNLGAEELGSVYESLLELQPELDTSAATFELGTVGGNERKTTGSYYTPDSLVRSLLDTALDPVLDEAVKKPDPESAILSLKVCDPACGSGHFLIAAARRIAKRLASVRTGDEEPSPLRTREALREVIGGCIHGVDVSPMAAELCKVSLWMEALVPGKPLSFLDHHVKVGNALLGATPELVAKGIPGEAFKPVEGDDRETANAYRKRNREERKAWEAEQGCFSFATLDAEQEIVESGYEEVEATADRSVSAVREKEKRHRELESSPDLAHLRLIHDAYCAAFLWPKSKAGPEPITQRDFAALTRSPDALSGERQRGVERIRQSYNLFHWHLEFPEVFKDGGGFDVVLGNPPYGGLSSNRERHLICTVCPNARGAANLAADFLEYCINVVNQRGRIGLVVPKSLTYSYSWRSLRDLLYPRLLSVIDVGEAWKNVLLEQVLVTYSPVPADDESSSSLRLGKMGSGPVLRRATLPAAIVEKLGTVPTGLDADEVQLLRHLMQKSGGNLGEVCTTKRGTGLQKSFDPGGDLALLGGKEISEFQISELTRFVDSPSLTRPVQPVRPPQAVFQNIVAHLTRPADHIRLIGAVARTEVACLDTVNLLELHDRTLSPWGVTALLMSNLVNWFVYACVYNKAVRTMHFDGYFLNKIQLPPNLDGATLHDVGLALEIDPENSEAWTTLNEAVYEMYEVAPPVKQRVEDRHKPRWFR